MHEVQPLLAQTTRMRQLSALTTYSGVRLTAVRDGSAILSGGFGQRPIRSGDVLLIGANVTYGMEPEGQVTVTAVYLDPDYAVDQFYWQHTGGRGSLILPHEDDPRRSSRRTKIVCLLWRVSVSRHGIRARH